MFACGPQRSRGDASEQADARKRCDHCTAPNFAYSTSMTNPYVPPTKRTTIAAATRKRISFVGGLFSVVIVALLFGTGVGALIGYPLFRISLYIYGVPFFGLFTALAVLICLLRDSPLPSGSGVLLAFGLTVPAFVLYVPICTFTSMATKSWLPSKDYGPAPSGMVVGSAVAFLLIMLAAAGLFRVFCKPQETREDDASSAHGKRSSENEYS